jgi:hypothetical protein
MLQRRTMNGLKTRSKPPIFKIFMLLLAVTAYVLAFFDFLPFELSPKVGGRALAAKVELVLPENGTFAGKLARAALDRTKQKISYDGAYVKIDYPGGDVPPGQGVCTDVVIRSYRTLGIDLQKNVHEDMQANFKRYPNTWGLKKTDTNIDHRRVPNLEVYFSRYGQKLSRSKDPDDYETGDLVTWKLGNGRPHIGIVVRGRIGKNERPLMVHNIGAGPMLEDVLFDWKITGHYRYPKPAK